MRLRVSEALGAVVMTAVAIAAAAIALASLWGCSSGGAEAAAWPESAEFSTLESGQDRWSWHEVGGPGIRAWFVVVDHETGAQYLYAAGSGLCPLLDADGSPLLVAEAGE